MCQIGGLACVAIRFPSDAVSRSLRIQIWILTAVGDSVTDLPPFSRVTSGWLTSGYSQFASARTQITCPLTFRFVIAFDPFTVSLAAASAWFIFAGRSHLRTVTRLSNESDPCELASRDHLAEPYAEDSSNGKVALPPPVGAATVAAALAAALAAPAAEAADELTLTVSRPPLMRLAPRSRP